MPENDASTIKRFLIVQFHSAAWQPRSKPVAPNPDRLYFSFEIESALLATSRIPFAVGDPIEYKHEKYVDAGITEPIPLEAAMTGGATHIMVLQTRPAGATVKASVLDPLH